MAKEGFLKEANLRPRKWLEEGQEERGPRLREGQRGWRVASEGRSAERLADKPEAITKINSFVTLGFPIWNAFLTVPACMCQAHPYSHSHLFLLSIAF